LIVALMQSHRIDEAIQVFPEALQRDSNNATLHFTYGSAVLDRGRSGKATTEFDRALALKPDLASARRDLEGASQVRRVK
jgi:Flp pilus assembly protein TadD